MKAILNLIEEATKHDCLDNLSRAELRGLIEKIKAEAYSKIGQAEHKDDHTYTALEVEAIQDLTINCYKDLYERMEDHVSVLIELRDWGVEFEEWWLSIDEDERDNKDYWEEIDNFGAKKLKKLRYPDVLETLETLSREIQGWEWTDNDDKNLLTKLNGIIDQLKKEE